MNREEGDKTKNVHMVVMPEHPPPISFLPCGYLHPRMKYFCVVMVFLGLNELGGFSRGSERLFLVVNGRFWKDITKVGCCMDTVAPHS